MHRQKPVQIDMQARTCGSRRPGCLVSACLAGLCTRYDGRSRPSDDCLRQLTAYHWIPICPEQLGGLATPRTAANLEHGNGFDVLCGKARVITLDGRDVTKNFILGARQVLAIARQQEITLAFLKARSPSCGLYPRPGVTAALLQQHGIRCREF